MHFLGYSSFFVTNINLSLHVATYAVSINMFFNDIEEAFRSKRPTTLVLSYFQNVSQCFTQTQTWVETQYWNKNSDLHHDAIIYS